jgi:hypothetical protein
MKTKHKVHVLSILMVVLLLGCGAKEDGIPDDPAAFMWNGSVYLISSRVVKSEETSYQVGTVKQLVRTFPAEDGQSNAAPRGSKIYRLKAGTTELVICYYGSCFEAAEEVKSKIVDNIIMTASS